MATAADPSPVLQPARPRALPQPSGAPGETAAGAFRVALVCMPFASAERPSIQLGLLTALAQRAGYPCDAYHLNLDLAAELSPSRYELFCEHRGHMTAEWLFAPAAFGAQAPDDEAYFRAFPEELLWFRDAGHDEAAVRNLRHRVLPHFIEKCFRAVDWGRYRFVGFSSTFQQNVACLALARRIKEGHPDLTVVFGGANMEGEMGSEFARAFPFVDYVVSGEADTAFPTLLDVLAAGQSSFASPGIIANTPEGPTVGGQAAPVKDLDSLPVPSYDCYFDRANQLGLSKHYQAEWTLPFETSRGCWWGQKHHCTFCGLNGLSMGYRAKSPPRVLAELSELARRHAITAFSAVDNILDWRYIPELFARIESARADYLFFYEVKANLTREQLRTLYRGGVRRIQPGIESMSTHVLQLMRKGCTMLQNVRCLKWCVYYGIRVDWNLIWGFPGETEADYEAELQVLRRLTHLEPPLSSSRIWLERFSPYYTDQAGFGVRHVRATASYAHVYPPHVDLNRIAYFFDYEIENTVRPEAHHDTEEFLNSWRRSWHSGHRPTLTYRRTHDGILIDYNWSPDRQGTYTLREPFGLIYEYCGDTMRTPPQVAAHLRQLDADVYSYSAEEVRQALDEFCRAGLMLSEDGTYLSLAIPSNPNW
jgi:ribosomal peptide maturation radical SAM protein 1